MAEASPADRQAPPISIIIPAHNEGSVITRCLDGLSSGLPVGTEVIVVCNGCVDDTAQIARGHRLRPLVVELLDASKIAALNRGDLEATGLVRAYVDADIEVLGSAVGAVAQTLDRDALCAAPAPVFVTEGRPWIVRAFYRVWQEVPYMKDNMVGCGFYALSAEGRRRFGPFPQVTGDDKFVLEMFSSEERRSLPEVCFRIHTPTAVRGLLQMRIRTYRGNLELDASHSPASGAQHRPSSGTGTLLQLARSPSWLPAVGVYLSMNILARLLARRSWDGVWERDQSARQAATAERTS